MCDPVTAAAMAGGGQLGASLWGNYNATKVEYKAAKDNLETNYASVSNQQDAILDMFLEGLGVRQADARYEESAIQVLGSEMGLDANASAILQRESKQTTARDMNAMKQNFDSQLDELDSFKRNSLSQFKASLKGAKAKNTAANTQAVLGAVSFATNLAMSATAKPTPTGG